MPSNEEATEKFVIGNTVQLNSGGPKMTVHNVNNQGIVCAWFNGKNPSSRHFNLSN